MRAATRGSPRREHRHRRQQRQPGLAGAREDRHRDRPSRRRPDRRGIEDAYRWMQSAHALEEPLAILQSHSGACPTWDDRLRALALNADSRFVGSMMSVVAAAIAPLALPTVRASLTPGPGHPAITAEALLDGAGTLYALATDRGAAASAGLVSALIEDIAYTARITAARSPGGHLDPPVLFLLDECANVAPIPPLPASWPTAAGRTSPSSPCSRPSPRSAPATAPRMPPPSSRPPRSSSSSAAPTTPTTAATCPPSSANATTGTPPAATPPTPSRSTPRPPRPRRYARSRSFPPTPSAPSRSAPPSCFSRRPDPIPLHAPVDRTPRRVPHRRRAAGRRGPAPRHPHGQPMTRPTSTS